MNKMFTLITVIGLFTSIANAATVNDNTLEGTIARLEADTNNFPMGYSVEPTQSISRVNGFPVPVVTQVDTNTTVTTTSYTALSPYEILAAPNDATAIAYISKASGTNNWERIIPSTRLFEVVATDTNVDVTASSYTATAAYQVLFTPNDTQAVFYVSTAAGTNSWRGAKIK